MYKYIIVDDEYIIRKGIVKKIESSGLDIVLAGEAENGKEALELIESQNPDIILTDMRMPIMDGKSLLQTLQKDYHKKQVIVISGYSDFEYMQEAISANVVSYLLKPFNRESITAAFQKAIAQIEKDQLITKKVQGAEFKEDMDLLRSLITSPYEPGSAVSLKSPQLLGLRDKQGFVLACVSSEQKLNAEEVRKSMDCIYIENSQVPNTSFILFTFDETDEKRAIKAVSDFLMKNFNPSAALFGISSMKKALTELNQAYSETISALNSKKLSESSDIFTFVPETCTPKAFNWPHTDELLFFVESGNTAKVTELTSDYFAFLTAVPETDLATIKFNCQGLFDRVRDLLKNYFETLTCSSFSSSYERIMVYLFDVDSIIAYFQQLFSNISNMMKEKNVYPSDQLVNNIKKYVAKNYMRDLTLENIANMFFINRSYCSTLFKEKTGDNFTDYINNIRIQRAKELLKSTDIQVFKIAKTLGYDNTKYFFRVFKKTTGYTPEQFRSLRESEES